MRAAADDLARLVDQAGDRALQLRLLRDVTEICIAAFDFACARTFQNAAFQLASRDDVLKPQLPELLADLATILVWIDSKDELATLFRNGPPAIDPLRYPRALAQASLAANTYYQREGNRVAAENALASAIAGLLLVDPSETYAIAKLLIGVLDAFLVGQDHVGANSLVAVIEPYLAANLDHRGSDWARYRYLVAQLLALTNRPRQAAPALAEAAALYAPQDINPDQRLYSIATSNSLLSLALLLDGDLAEATRVHDANPFQASRSAIIERKAFATLQEYYFAVSDALIARLNRTGREQAWKPLFEGQLAWTFTPAELPNVESYRSFARALIAPDGSKEAAELAQAALRQRIAVSDAVLNGKFEGFSLPTSIDRVMLAFGVDAVLAAPPPDRDDLLLKAGELAQRSLRHQLSDFAVLMGAQSSAEARDGARALNALAVRKRDFELRQIAALLDRSAPREAKSTAATYANLAMALISLKDNLARNQRYAGAAGYPDVSDIQRALGDNEVFVSYFPASREVGRLCISRTAATHSMMALDRQQWLLDLKLLRAAFTADHAPDPVSDSQFPVAAAIRVQHVLLGGLGACIKPGAHVIVAIPPEAAGIPLAALLAKEPPRTRSGYDLAAAEWLGKRFSFSVTVSARHLLGTKRSLGHRFATKPYLGIGDPDLAPSKAANGAKPAAANLYKAELASLEPVAMAGDEIRAASALMGQASRRLTGADATEAALRASEPGVFDIIHFATHGLFKGELAGLTESALVLTPPLGDDDGRDDGLLTVSEIARLSLNARLVVLSACNTARIDTGAVGLGAADIQAAFAAAGAPALVASLWSVETRAAHDLVVELFRTWKGQAEKSASVALADATRRYLKRADRAHQHPRFWASFVVLGYGGGLPQIGTDPSGPNPLFRPSNPRHEPVPVTSR